MNEIAQNKNIILFIDELHTLVGAGAAEGAIDASNMLKPALARGELQCVGASTLNEYRKYIEKDGALERRFQTVIVDPPSVDETVEILKGLRKKYEDHHRVTIPDATLDRGGEALGALHHRPVPAGQGDRRDRRGGRAGAARGAGAAAGGGGAQGRSSRRSTREKEAAVRDQNFERAAVAARPGARAAEPDPAQAGGVGAASARRTARCIDEEDIAFIVSRWTGIPVTRLQEAETARLLRMEDELHQSVVGQDEAIKAVVAGDPAQPRGAQGSEPADRLVHLLRPHRRRQDRAGARAGQVPVRRPAGADPRRHVGVHGEVLGVAADRRASGLRRLRGLGHADQGGAAEALLGRPARRDREGAPGRVQHPAPGARRGPPDRQLRPGDRLQEHRRDHDVERGRPGHHAGQVARLPRRPTRRRASSRCRRRSRRR